MSRKKLIYKGRHNVPAGIITISAFLLGSCRKTSQNQPVKQSIWVAVEGERVFGQ